MIRTSVTTHNAFWISLTFAGAIGIAVLLAAVSNYNDQLSILLALGLLGGTLFLIVLAYATLGRAWAISTYLGLTIFFIDAYFRVSAVADEMSFGWQSLLKLIIWGGAFIIGLVQLPTTYCSLLKPPTVFLLFYAVWALVSTLYSVTPAYTFGGGFALLSFMLFAPAVVRVLSPRNIVMTIAVSLGIFLSISWTTYAIFPAFGSTLTWTPLGYVQRLDGLAAHANTLGRLAALFLAMLFLLYFYRYGRIKLLLALSTLGFVTLAFTQSRTAALGLVAAIAIFALRRRPWLLIPIVLLSFTGTLYFASSTDDGIEILEAFSRSGRIQEIVTLTGRTQVWAFVLERIREAPLVGYGYASSRFLISSQYESSGGWTTIHAHNMILQSLITLGIIGTLPLLMSLWHQTVDFFKNPVAFRDLLFIFVLLTGVAEAGAIGPVPSTLTLLWLTSLFWVKEKAIKKRSEGT